MTDPQARLPGVASDGRAASSCSAGRTKPGSSQRSSSVASPTSQPRRGSRSRSTSLTRARLWSSSPSYEKRSRTRRSEPWTTLALTCSIATSCVRPRCRRGGQPDLGGAAATPSSRGVDRERSPSRAEEQAREGARVLPLGRRDVLHRARRGALAGEDRLMADAASRAQGRHGRLLRPRRLHLACGIARPGGRRGDPSPVPRARSRRARTTRRHRREVHRRRGDGALRRTDGPRGRSRARRPRGARDPRLRRSRRSWSCVSGSRRARRSSRSTPGPTPARAWPLATSSTQPHACRAPRPSTGSSSTRRRTGPRAQPSTTRRRSRRSEGQDRAGRCLDGSRGACALRRRRRARGALGAHRARARARRRQRRVRARTPRATPQLLTLVGVPGIGKSRLVYELNRIVEADPRSSRGDRDDASPTGTGSRCGRSARSSRHRPVSSSRTRRTTSPRRSTRLSRTRWQVRGTRRASNRTFSRLLGISGETQLGGDRRNDAFAAWRRFSRASPSSARSSSSWKTSTGPTRASSTSSTSSSTG